MTITRLYSLFVSILILLLLFVNYSGASQDTSMPLDNESGETLTLGVLEKRITIVPQLNKLNFGL